MSLISCPVDYEGCYRFFSSPSPQFLQTWSPSNSHSLEGGDVVRGTTWVYLYGHLKHSQVFPKDMDDWLWDFVQALTSRVRLGVRTRWWKGKGCWPLPGTGTTNADTVVVGDAEKGDSRSAETEQRKPRVLWICHFIPPDLKLAAGV